MTPITYREAAKMLEVKESIVRNAVHLDNLTQLPIREQKKHVVKEQVELFIGKQMISKKLLSPEEMKLWEKYRDEATQPEKLPVASLSVDEILKQAIDQAVETSIEKFLERLTYGFKEREVPKGHPLAQELLTQS